jgi:hypothetical protein
VETCWNCTKPFLKKPLELPLGGGGK